MMFVSGLCSHLVLWEDRNKIQLKNNYWRSHRDAAETNPTRTQEVVGLIPGLDQWVKNLG